MRALLWAPAAVLDGCLSSDIYIYFFYFLIIIFFLTSPAVEAPPDGAIPWQPGISKGNYAKNK